jgi:hypothetical protein
MNAHCAVFPMLSIDQAATLGRIVLLDEVPGNGETWFVARCFELLRAGRCRGRELRRPGAASERSRRARVPRPPSTAPQRF